MLTPRPTLPRVRRLLVAIAAAVLFCNLQRHFGFVSSNKVSVVKPKEYAAVDVAALRSPAPASTAGVTAAAGIAVDGGVVVSRS